MRIDLDYLKSITDDKTNRTKEWKTDWKLVNELGFMFTGIKDWIQSNTTLKKSNLASFIISAYRWVIAEKNNQKRHLFDKTKRPIPLKYEVREIIYADLGGTNFGVEASYEHPAIVLHNGYYFLVVIPGSTGRVSKGDYIINAGTSENFSHATGIQVDQIRVIDKSRVIRRTGKKVPMPFMNKINDIILEKYLNPVKKNLDKLKIDNTTLIQDKNKLILDNEALTNENEALKAQLSVLEKKVLESKE